jgi:type I restriction enzyme S subunit
MSCSGWKEVKLGDLLNFRRGHDLPKTKMNDGRIPVVGSNGVIGIHDEFTTKAPCLTIGRSGNIGNPYYIDTDCWAHNTTLYVDDFKGNDPKYLYYLLKTLNLGYYGGGSAVPTLNRNHIHPVEVEATVNKIEQKAIAATLSCLDDKIELNNRINKNLEEMAQAIFKNWFVDFEPFKDGEFEDSELRRIPKGWILKSIFDFAEYINGTSFKKEEYSLSGYPIIKISELKNGIMNTTEYFCGKKDAKYYIKTGDILFSWSGNPQTSIDTFIWVGGDAILNQHTFKIELINEDYSFVYLLLKYFKPEFTRIASSKQTTGLGHVTVGDLKRIKFPCSLEEIRHFCAIVDPVIYMYVNNLIENEKLKKVRDTLLPKLMSGEIPVPFEQAEMV